MKGKRVLPIMLAVCLLLGNLPGVCSGGVLKAQAAAIGTNLEGTDGTVSGNEGTVSGNDALTPADVPETALDGDAAAVAADIACQL